MTDTLPLKPPSLTRALILSVLLVVFDALWLGQGLISLALAIGLLMISLPRTFFPRFKPVRRARLRNLAIYLAAVAVVWGLNLANDRLARSRAEEVISAVNLFKTAEGRYPKSLQELVPAYLNRVPRAKYTLMFGEFRYFGANEEPLLMYTAMPPFGRPIYSFSRSAWSRLD